MLMFFTFFWEIFVLLLGLGILINTLDCIFLEGRGFSVVFSCDIIRIDLLLTLLTRGRWMVLVYFFLLFLNIVAIEKWGLLIKGVFGFYFLEGVFLGEIFLATDLIEGMLKWGGVRIAVGFGFLNGEGGGAGVLRVIAEGIDWEWFLLHQLLLLITKLLK